MKTYSPRPRDIERRWYVIDASGAVLGRLATEAASILRGKHKPIFAPHMDTGDHVIVVNAKGIQITGGKGETKVAYRHSGYPGGLTETKYAKLLAEKPAFAVEKAIRGMLPKNRLGRAMARKLQVYAGPEHPHQAQQPEALRLGEIPKWTGLPKPAAAPQPGERTRPEPAKPARKPSTAKRTTAKPAAKASTAKRPVAKSTAKRTTAKTSTAKKSTAKRTTATKTSTVKSTAKRIGARRKKKEE
jgi:large subunit ribosomal protein L13